MKLDKIKNKEIKGKKVRTDNSGILNKEYPIRVNGDEITFKINEDDGCDTDTIIDTVKAMENDQDFDSLILGDYLSVVIDRLKRKKAKV